MNADGSYFRELSRNLEPEAVVSDRKAVETVNRQNRVEYARKEAIMTKYVRRNMDFHILKISSLASLTSFAIDKERF